jgi:hypothetical protein
MLFAAPTALAAKPVYRAPGVTVYADASAGDWGVRITAHEFEGIQQALSPSALHGSVLEVANPQPDSSHAVTLTNLPAVSRQGVPGSVGSPGSCEAQSFGYCLGAYTAARNPDGSVKWNAADANNAPSAAWLYQWEHAIVENDKRVCPGGSGATPYANRLVRDGAPSTAQVPYNPDVATTPHTVCSYITTLDVQRSWPGQSRFLIGSYKAYTGLKNGKAKYLSLFKELIRHGHAIAFTGLVARKYGVESPHLTRGAFTAPAGFLPNSGHGQVIVGYDDSVGPHGAFLVQNSFGAGWNPGPASSPGHNGRIYWGYNAFFASQAYAIVMFPNTNQPVRGTLLSTNASQAPAFAVASAKRAVDAQGRPRLVLVTHASDAVTVKHLSITAPNGAAESQKLNEMLRIGYQYVERASNAPFVSGAYKVAYTVLDRTGRQIVYRGTVHV